LVTIIVSLVMNINTYLISIGLTKEYIVKKKLLMCCYFWTFILLTQSGKVMNIQYMIYKREIVKIYLFKMKSSRILSLKFEKIVYYWWLESLALRESDRVFVGNIVGTISVEGIWVIHNLWLNDLIIKK